MSTITANSSVSNAANMHAMAQAQRAHERSQEAIASGQKTSDSSSTHSSSSTRNSTGGSGNPEDRVGQLLDVSA